MSLSSSLLLLCLASSAFAGVLYPNDQSTRVKTGKSLILFRGAKLNVFDSVHGRIVEPLVAYRNRLDSTIRRIEKDPLGAGYFVTFALYVSAGEDLLKEAKKSVKDSAPLSVLQVDDIRVSLRKSYQDKSSVSVTSFWHPGNQPRIVFRCPDKRQCEHIVCSLERNDPNNDMLRGSLRIKVSGQAGRQRMNIVKTSLPRLVHIHQGFQRSDDKEILFTMKAVINKKFYDTFMNKQTYKLPDNGGLPDVYRSDKLDNLKIATIGKREIVVEMFTGKTLVSQLVFDVTKQRSELERENWFSMSRLIFSYPYNIVGVKFQSFSVAGDYNRRLFANYGYKGHCKDDSAFILILDRKDVCPWGQTGWKSAPRFMYTTRRDTWQKAGKNADRLVIYMR